LERDKEAAGRYRKRAEKVRTIANDTGDKGVRRILTGVADDYDQMARDQDEGTRSDEQRQKPKQ
jgi:hypothetical protein